MNKRPSGQLGNQLFQLNLLLQLEKKLGLESFRYGFNLGETFKISANRFKWESFQAFKFSKLVREEIELLSLEDLATLISEKIHSDRIPIIPPGILGKNFFKVAELHPRSLFPIKRNPVHFNAEHQHKHMKVGIHFRGRDFEKWNPRASMSLDFYSRAIDQLQIAHSDSEISFELFTDDASHPVARGLQEWEFIDFNSNQKVSEDFVSLANCDVIVAGPSTFAFWATLLAKESDLVMSSEWFSFCEGIGDTFWLDVKSSLEKISGKLIQV
jgi:hypothetical protein